LGARVRKCPAIREVQQLKEDDIKSLKAMLKAFVFQKDLLKQLA
jgi:hypothetical protein